MEIKKCQHPALIRRAIARFSILGEGFAGRLNDFANNIQKIANVLRFEHFWTRHVSSQESVEVVQSFNVAKSKHEIWNLAIKHVTKLRDNGVFLEFGTNNGGSLLYFQERFPESMALHGFDCFEGIPEKWDSLTRGSIKGNGYPSELWHRDPMGRVLAERHLSMTGEIIQPPQKNIKIHKGLFAHTLPNVMTPNVLENITFIHFDADIYMGTRPVLDAVCGQIKQKYYILFDEFYSVNHEFKAWIEFIENFSITKWRVIAISTDGVQALFEVN